jgi:hypothetical protein
MAVIMIFFTMGALLIVQKKMLMKSGDYVNEGYAKKET